MGRLPLAAALCAVALTGAASTAQAHHDFGDGDTSAGLDEPTLSKNMRMTFNSPTGQVNSDMAFWGDHAFVGNYGGLRIFDISTNEPTLVKNFVCYGPQNDVSVWDRDGNGRADLMITSVDLTLTGPECGSTFAGHDNPDGWEGLRIFDISDMQNPEMIGSVYQDCGSHTHTLVPQPERGRLLVLNSSYPLRPGPTCGPVRGPEAGRDPLHGVIQVVSIPLGDPAAAEEIAELPIDYPGDPDNKFVPAEHGLDFPGLVQGMRACHDIAVFMEAELIAGACAEQAQLWRMDADGLPDTENPIWVYDEPYVDFWHSATFTWDAKVVNFIDESFGSGCPPVTPYPEGDKLTGKMYFVDAASGRKLADFMIDRNPPGDAGGDYCSSHLGSFVPSAGRYLLANAWYRGGANVVDASDMSNVREVAFFNAHNQDNWSVYWYERNPKPDSDMTIWGNDGVHAPATGYGFQKFKAGVRGERAGLERFNPQVQENLITSAAPRRSAGKARASRTRRTATAAPKGRTGRVSGRAVKRLAP